MKRAGNVRERGGVKGEIGEGRERRRVRRNREWDEAARSEREGKDGG